MISIFNLLDYLDLFNFTNLLMSSMPLNVGTILSASLALLILMSLLEDVDVM